MTRSPCGRYLVRVLGIRFALEKLYEAPTTTLWKENYYACLVLGLS